MSERPRAAVRAKARRKTLDAIVRAVATGVFVSSLALNLLFVLLVVLLGSALGTLREREFDRAGYRKVYSGEFHPSTKGAGNELAVVRVTGLITEYDSSYGIIGYNENSVSAVLNRLAAIRKDRNVKGVLLVVDSPGGGVTASDVIYHGVREFKEETGIPVVTLMNQVAASGAYYIASASDYIVAHPTTITGSIGVIIYGFNFKGLMDRYGVKYVAVKTGDFKDMVSPFKGVEEAELAYMQKIVDRMLDKFIRAVAEGRKNLSYQQVKKLSDGKVYIADDAVRLGLIDAVGYYRDAVDALAQRAGVAEPSVVEFERERGLMDMFTALLSRTSPRSLLGVLDSEILRYPDGMYFVWEGASLSR